jgi:hypothetical protein
LLQRLFWAIESIHPHPTSQVGWKTAVDLLVSTLNHAIDHSPGLNLRRLEISNGQVDLFPEGIKLLDDAVDENAVWLKTYPDVAKEFSNALRICATKDIKLYRQALDSLRFALENLLKIVLANNASLEKQKEPLLKWMKKMGVHPHIRQTYSTVLTQLNSYQNAAVKHPDKPDPDDIREYSPNELEYVIYLTSALMRFILQLHRTGGSG